MNYDEALNYIHSISWTFTKPGLERIGELCRRLGNPQNDLKFVHVVGTNGKGSFCSMLDSVLRSASYKVGLFTSPYIKEFTERIRVSSGLTTFVGCSIGKPFSHKQVAFLDGSPYS